MSFVPVFSLSLFLAATTLAAPAPPPALIAKGSTWKYLDTGTQAPDGWEKPEFDDSAWRAGAGKLGFSDAAKTVLNAGKDPKNRPVTYYFRTAFNVPEPLPAGGIQVDLLRDDGAVLFLNGKEVLRSNLPAGPLRHDTLARSNISAANELAYARHLLKPGCLVAGKNVLAVAVHQCSRASSDLGFDLALYALGEPVAAPATGSGLVRGPYLQQASPTTMTVRWRTARPEVGVVRYGPSPDNLTGSVTGESTTDHVITLTGLTPKTTYHYSVGSAAATLAGGNPSTRFTTSPPPGEEQPTRVWVLGDPGTKTVNQALVRNAFYKYTANRLPDLWLLLGDNAYDRGTDAEYQKAIFEMYPAMLRQVPVWACIGNHDTDQAVSYVDTYPYFHIFTFPKKGECGGVPSETEHFYSFDYANIHFISLDSMTANRRPDGRMATWLAKDLAAVTATWTIVLFHHPPYTKGSHDSDTEKELVGMRHQILPILEAGGVDLVLNGHSHAYERTFPLDGHYGTSDTFRTTMKKFPGDGNPQGSGPYVKPLTGPKAHSGTIYNVAGSAGQISGGKLNHPAMFRSFNELGSVVLDIEGNQLTSSFLDTHGVVRDCYRIIKRDGN